MTCKTSNSPTQLDCTIVVPTRNRPKALFTVFDSLLRLNSNSYSYEILVVNDGGSLDPAIVLQDYKGLLAFRVLHQQHSGPGVARNHGASHARGRLLLFTDDDCVPDPNWLDGFMTAHVHNPQALLGGVTGNALPQNRWSTASESIVMMARQFYNELPDGPRFFPTNNLAVPTRLFRNIGGFDPGFVFASEDRDLCDRWRQAGLPLLEVSAARVVHAHPLKPTTFFRQHLAYGKGAWRYHRIRRCRGHGSIRTDLGFYLRLPTLFLVATSPGNRVRALFPLLIWQLANLLGFLRAAIGYYHFETNSYLRRLV